MTELDHQDIVWAENFGAHWGATYPTPQGSVEDISRAFGDAVDGPLNALAIAHQKRFLGIADHVELTDAQARAAAPYLTALADVVLREMQWALYWRRQKLDRGESDPGIGYLTLRAEPTFRDYLAATGPTTEGRVRTTTTDGVEYFNQPTTTPKGQNLRHDAIVDGVSRMSFSERRKAKKAREVAEAERALAAHRAQQQWDLDQRRRAREATRRREEQARLEQEEIRRRRPEPPSPQPYGVNHQGAERLVADWMRHLGVHDASVTQYSGDGGIDVDSRHIIAQVKNLHVAASVPIAHIRDLFGTAQHRHKGAVLFTSGMVSSNGLAFADETGLALIRYDAEKGTLAGLNQRGRQVVAAGFPLVFGFDEF
ncbi:restriction endonuclease [Microbacterium aurugineum]|uniref:Restriction endonuclease n=1 Tax=Microbacterium aurugineum TaxID=2851642 RepID=A0ABY4J087_9MICO|nr:restriction endonuclease [Microbacterium aurugineum]UPL17496.1 restriction endonuclease [Microbacterium aurugineum]